MVIMYGNTKQVCLNVLNMQILNGLLFVGCLLTLVPGGEGAEEDSPITAQGEKPTCPEGSPTYELPIYSFPLYCVKDSEHCNLETEAKQKTYFYPGIINCNSKSFIVVVYRHEGGGDKRFVLDALAAKNSFPTDKQMGSSVFPVFRGHESPMIYYKLEDKSCYRASYTLSGGPEIAYDKPLGEGTVSDICKAVKDGLGEFVSKDEFDNWKFVHVCSSLDEGPVKVDCTEIESLQVIPDDPEPAQ